ncbi:MAG: hypothetical protein J0M26_20880 [Planctomycetes bacterium]|nr:hypothetical protein [Planctomycetota bacterium]
MHRYLCVLLIALIGGLVGCSGNFTPSEPPNERLNPARTANSIPLQQLLEQLPKDRWPKKGDSLQWSLARQWYEQNLVGKRASLSLSSHPRKPDFSPAADGTFNVTFWANVSPLKLYDGTFSTGIGTPGRGTDAGNCTLDVSGLSRAQAEELRALPYETPVGVDFTILGVHGPGDYADLLIQVDQVSFEFVQ